MEAKPYQREPKGHEKWESLWEHLIWTAPSGQRGAKRCEIKPKTIKMKSKEGEQGAKWKQNRTKGNQKDPTN